MRFSILIPVYNVEQYLRECLDSIVNQTFKDFEVVLIDDGSTDQSGGICDEYAKLFNNIRVIHQENRGVMYSRTLAYSLAQGEYCVAVDSDDFIALDMLEILENRITKYNPDIILIHAQKYYAGRYYTHKVPLYTEERYFCEDKKEIYRRILCRDLSNAMWSKIVKRVLFADSNKQWLYNDIVMGEDFLQSLSVLTSARSIYYVNKPLYFYRTNFNSATQNFSMKHYDSLEKVNRVLDTYVPLWDCEDGVSLAAYRYLVDMYDVVCAVFKTKCSKKIREVLNRLMESSYFAQKYAAADKSLLTKRQSWLMYGLIHRNSFVLWNVQLFFGIIEQLRRVLILSSLKR